MKRVRKSIGSRAAARVAVAGIVGVAVMAAPVALRGDLRMVVNGAVAQTVNGSQLSLLPPSYTPPTNLPSPGHPWYFYRPDYVQSLLPHSVVGTGLGPAAAASNAENGNGGKGGPGGPGSHGR
jgi:hypothetical protein